MFIHKLKKKIGNKAYYSVLLRESYRENGKVKMKTLLNLSNWKPEIVEALRKTLKGEVLFSQAELSFKSGKSLGLLYVLKVLADRLGVTKALGTSREALLTLIMIVGRIINQGSKLSTVYWAKGQAKEEVLGLFPFDEDDLYETLDWLDENQEEIEKRLFNLRLKRKVNSLFLYDVTSSYLEGEKNELANFGYNRDGKKGKKQIVVGLLTDEEGYPVSVEIFKGSTQDTKTFPSQIEKLTQRFGVEKVVLVGDKGMIKDTSIMLLKEKGFNFITSITKPQIESLVREGVIQLSFFDTDLYEVEHEGIRYLLRKNPERAAQTQENRRERLDKTLKELVLMGEKLENSKRVDPEKTLRKAAVLAEKRKVGKYLKIQLEGRKLTFSLFKEVLLKDRALDGCYVIKTDLKKEEMEKEKVHQRYKDLFLIEQAFKTMKTDLLEIRPIYHRKASRTRGHVFVTMLAYLITRELKRLTTSLPFSLENILESLARIQLVELTLKDKKIKQVAKPDEEQKTILKALNITLPRSYPTVSTTSQANQ